MRARVSLAAVVLLAAVVVALTGGGAARAAGETIRIDDAATLASTDPLDQAGAVSYQMLQLTCAKLYNLPDLAGAAGYATQPEVASGLPVVTNGGLTATIDLNTGYAFSNGEPVTAQTFVRVLQRLQGPAGGGFDTSWLGAATANGDYELVLTLTRPVSNLVEILAAGWMCAEPSTVPLDSGFADPTTPAAGPYYVASVSGNEWVLKQNPGYGGSRIRNLGEIDWFNAVDPATALADVEAGTADYAANLSGQDFAALDAQYGAGSAAAADGHQQYFSNQAAWTDFVDLNNASGQAFSDYAADGTFRPNAVKLREAVATAIDRNTFAADATSPASPTAQILPPGFPGYEPLGELYPFGGDELAAITLAQEAGVDTAHPITVEAYFKTPRVAQENASVLESELSSALSPLGINLDVHEIADPNQYFSIIGSGGGNPTFDLTFFGWIADYADPYDFLNTLLDGSALGTSFNSDVAQYRPDATLAQQLADAAALPPGTERNAAYAQLDHDLSVAAPMVPVLNVDHPDFFSSRMGCEVYQPIFGINVNDLCVRVANVVGDGGTVSTGTTTSTDAPLQTSVTTPIGGEVSIQQGIATDTVTNYQLLAQQLTITAPAASAGDPLQLTFTLDPSLLGATDPAAIDVIRDGVPVPACTDSSGQASPDPCLASRSVLGDGSLQLVVLSSHASLWNFGIRLDQPPVCTSASASPSTLWPADGRLVPIAIDGITDPDGDAVQVAVTSVTQNEPGTDWVRTPDGVSVRATRLGSGSGRVYTIAFTASDGQDASCDGSVAVVVPHDQRK